MAENRTKMRLEGPFTGAKRLLQPLQMQPLTYQHASIGCRCGAHSAYMHLDGNDGTAGFRIFGARSEFLLIALRYG
jgi:hypothetical protein